MTRGRAAGAVAFAAALAILSLASGSPARADATGAFPNLEPWPADLALGGIPVALGEGVQAALENPTGMLVNGATGFAFSHASLFTGGLVTHQSFAFCLARREEQVTWNNGRVRQGHGETGSAFGIGVTNLSGELPGDESYGEMQISLAYARRVPLGMSAGVRLRFLQSRTTVDEMGGGGGYAVDLGVEDRILGFRVGLLAKAIASEIRWDRSLDGPIPSRFALSLERQVGKGFTAMAGLDLRSTAEPRRINIAGQWTVPGTPMTLQAGPSISSGDGQSVTEISAGTAIKLGAIAAQYGMRTGSTGLGEIHRFGIRVAIP